MDKDMFHHLSIYTTYFYYLKTERAIQSPELHLTRVILDPLACKHARYGLLVSSFGAGYPE